MAGEGDEDVKVSFGADLKALIAQLEGVGENIKSLTGPITAVKAAFAEIAEVVAAAFAVEKIAHWVESVTEAGAQIEHMSAQLGIGAAEVSAFTFAAGAMGVSTEAAGLTLERLERNMATAVAGTGPAAGAFEALGIKITNTHGGLKSLDEILPEIANKFQASADGPAKTAIAIDLLGRSGAQMIPFLNQGAEGLERFKAIASETGTIVTQGMAAGFEKTSISMYTMGKAVDGVGMTLYEAFKPAIDAVVTGLTDLIEGFNNALKGSGMLNGALAALVLSFDLVVGSIDIVITGLSQLWTMLEGLTVAAGQFGSTLVKVFTDLAHGDFAKAWEDAKAGAASIGTEFKATLEKMEQEGHDSTARLNSLFSNLKLEGGQLHVDTSGGGSGHEADKPQLGTPDQTGGKTQLDQWKRDLEEKIQAEVGFFASSSTLEAEFWQDKVNQAQGNTQLLEKVEHELYAAKKAMLKEDLDSWLAGLDAKEASVKNNYDAVMAIENQRLAQLAATYTEDSQQYKEALKKKEDLERQHQEELRRIEVEGAAARRDVSRINLDVEADNLNRQLALGEITATERLNQEKRLVDAKFALDRKDLEDQKTLGDQTLEQKAKLNDQIVVLEAKHGQDLNKLTNQQVIAAKATWQGLFSSISQGFNETIRGVLQGTQTMQQGFQRLLQNLTLSFINTRINIELDWLAGQAAMALGSQDWAGKSLLSWVATALGITTANTQADAAQVSSKSATAAALGGIDYGQKLGEIANSAAVAAAAAFASTSAIPIIGPFIAPGVAAASYAETAAWAAALTPLATGTFNVPQDMPAQLHKGEMVVPKPFADSIRDGGGMGGGGLHLSQTMHFHGITSAKDIPGIKAAVYDAVKEGQRNFVQTGPKRGMSF